ncbi:Facilitated trehalose transporter Tret1 [Halotydeus destructor]|nr:Facilitated trehalose transporter Tret1 [Halotydeus destructor]
MPVRRSAIEEDEEPIINIDHSIESSLSSSISKPSCFLFFAAFVALLNAVSFGLVAGYYSASIESMRNSSFNHVDWDEDKSSWIAAAQPIGALVGGLVGGPFMSLVGPKKALIYSNVPYATGWALIVFGVQFVDIMVGRTLGGFAVGLSCGIVPCYCVEISTQEIRGLLGMFFQLFVNGGIFIAWSAGKWLDYRWLGSMSGGVAILMPLLMIWCPESPVYLAKGGFPNRDKVLKSLRSLRNKNSSSRIRVRALG